MVTIVLNDPVVFYFDFISPFAYLAWKRIPALVETHNRQLQLQPVLFAGLLGHFGQLGPAEIPPKRVYIFKQVLRRAHERSLPLQPPPAHPFNPLLGLRLAGDPSLPAPAKRRLVDALFDATWGGGPGIDDPATVVSILDSAGLDGAARVAAANSTAAKSRLRQATQTAIELGVFGVPTIIADDELFWGDDSLDDVGHFLRGDDPITTETLAPWKNLPQSANRGGS